MLFAILAPVAVTIWACMTLLFLVAWCVRRNDLADVAWGAGIWLVGVVSYALTPVPSFVHSLVLVLVTFWALRLTVRIGIRNMHKPEDARYRRWREEWGIWFVPRSYVQIFMLQGALMIVVGYPLVHLSVFASTAVVGVFTYVGFVLWVIGFFFEVLGDYQLDRFLARKRRGETTKSVMDEGLWKYTRHPNYFGEVTMWWGIWCIVAPVSMSYIALISPLMITFLILRVSGIPMLERQFAGNPEWEAYKKRTSVFFPAPPK